MFQVIVACDEKGGIGYQGTIPWTLRSDLVRFKAITTNTKDPSKQNAVIMGRATWESLPMKPLPNRRNIIVSKTLDYNLPQGVMFACSLDGALSLAQSFEDIESIFIIGGEGLYHEAISHDDCTTVHLTLVHKTVLCDRFFPLEKLHSTQWTHHEHEKDTSYSFHTFVRKN